MHPEPHTMPPWTHFARGMLRHGGFVVALVVVSLAIGMVGYRETAGLSWVDAFLNTSMLLGGMGPVNELHTTSAKLFAGLFSLYSGLVFLVSAAVLVTPALHRVLHRFHVEKERQTRAARGA